MAELREGTLIQDRFEIRGYVGGGGFGSVWRAYDRQLEREVAIKRMLSSSPVDLTRRDEVIDEARKVASLSHPNIVSIFDVQEHDGEPLIVMEYLPGGSLQDELRNLSRLGKWVDPPQAFGLTAGILKGLDAAHTSERGPIIHRDLKPLNILFDRTGRAKIADFGLAAIGVVGEIPTSHPGKWAHEGTFGYMSPEQLKGAQLDQRSDLFNVGLITYLLFACSHPFTDPRFLFNYKEMVTEPYRALPLIKVECLPDEVGEFVRCLLAIEPKDRFQSAAESLTEFEHAMNRYNEKLLDRLLQLYDSLKLGSAAPDSISQAELAQGISLCKRDGFYIQGAFLYEKSGTDFADLSRPLREVLEHDYRFCRRRAGQEVPPA
jgi:serine/threonine protein kinase